MLIGQYKHHVEFIPQVETTDSVGDTITSNGTSYFRWAKMVSPGGVTSEVMEQQVSTQSWQIYTRWFPGLNMRHTIKFRDRTFAMQSFVDVDEAHKEYMITATEKRQAVTARAQAAIATTSTITGTLSLV